MRWWSALWQAAEKVKVEWNEQIAGQQQQRKSGAHRVESER
jgi:hypothetical protein